MSRDGKRRLRARGTACLSGVLLGPLISQERRLTVATLASGSAGNCTYVGDGQAGVLIDCGISTRQILRRMELLGLLDAPIDGVLVTHEHSDHVGAARVLSNRLRKRYDRPIPFFMTKGTRAGLRAQTTPESIEEIVAGQLFGIQHLQIDAFPVPHDTRDPVGFRVGIGRTWAGVVTDLGRPTSLVIDKFRSLAVAVLEFNHDFELLMGGAYPWALKQRIRSSHGHLSNEQAADLLARGLSSELQHLALAHLSGENNTPARALQVAAGVLGDHDLMDRVSLRVAEQVTPGPPMSVVVEDS